MACLITEPFLKSAELFDWQPRSPTTDKIYSAPTVSNIGRKANFAGSVLKQRSSPIKKQLKRALRITASAKRTATE
jgi:hypothetical protein